MTNVISHKSLKCIQWTVQTSQSVHTHISEVFSLHDCVCNFELSLRIRPGTDIFITRDATYLYFKSDRVLQSPAKITVHPSCSFVTLSPQTGSISKKHQSIWSYSDDYLDGSLLTFAVIFHYGDLKEDKNEQTEPHLNSNASMESLFKDYSELLDSGPNQDVEIKCGEFSMKAHKIILEARSNVFKAMLRSDMLEGRTGVVEIQDIDVRYVQDFVRYLYTGSVTDMTFDKAITLYEAGDKYAVGCLVLRCSEYLQDNLSEENVCKCFPLADKHADADLKNKVTAYILDEKIYLQGNLWLPFCENYPRLANEVYRLLHKFTEKE